MIDKLLSVLNALHPDIPVYGDEITEEERLINRSFFIYRNSNRFRRGQNGRGLLRELDLFYVTIDKKEIDIAGLIDGIVGATNASFTGPSQEDIGKIDGTDDTAFMVTMTFSYIVRRC